MIATSLRSKMPIAMTRLSVIIGICTVLTAPAHARQFQDTRILDALVAAKLGSEIGQPGGARAAVDSRLKLAQCPETPKVIDGTMDSAIIRCETLGWRIRVPVTAGGQNNNNAVMAANGTKSLPDRYNTQSNSIAIRRGEPVRLTIRRRGFTLARMMVADRNGRIGDVIPVRADRRDKPIMVRVTDIGEASVLSR